MKIIKKLVFRQQLQFPFSHRECFLSRGVTFGVNKFRMFQNGSNNGTAKKLLSLGQNWSLWSSFADNSDLTYFLKVKSTTKFSNANVPYQNYDVFVFELCDGTLSDLKECDLTLDKRKDICKQLLEGLKQLKDSGKCHNDLKPDNIFYKAAELNGQIDYEIKIGDFGTADRSGGTPGWTWPKFLSKREPGQSDGYSISLVILFIMCETKDLFYRLRDNYLELGMNLTTFREEPLIELVCDMMHQKRDVEEYIEWWNAMSDEFQILTVDILITECRIPRVFLDIQDKMDKNVIRFASATFLDK